MDSYASLVERQRFLESQATADGAIAYRQRLIAAEQAGNAAHVGGNKKLLSEAVGKVAAGITTWVGLVEHRSGGKHCAFKWVQLLGPDVTAYMMVKAVLDVLALKMPLNDVARSITKYMLDELRFRRFQEQAPGLFEYRLNSFTTSNYAHMAKSMAATAKYAEVDVTDLDMSESTKLLVGCKLLDILISTTGMLELQSKRIVKNTHGKGRRTAIRQEVVLVPAVETIEWLTKRNDMLALLQPVAMPMVVPPLRWQPKQRGGYRFSLRGRHPLVRGCDKRVQQARFDDATMPLVYDTLNALQETAWQVNPHVLELVRKIKLTGRALAGVPAFEPEPMPPKPPDNLITGDDDVSKERRRLYRKAKHAVHERNHARVVHTIEYSHTLKVADTLEHDDAIFFAYNLDFRGRIYPICSFLSPQGADLSKALLRFSEGKPLGLDGARWLALHGANCLDKTPEGAKMSSWSLDDRIDWIDAHTQDIIGVAMNPLEETWWAECAEKPLQFYAFCCEWAALNIGGEEGFVSYLPIAQDGSCNGLQHFSAMFRDPIGGAAVNLSPSQTPHDIYQTIADLVLDALAEGASTNPVALWWLQSSLVTRKLTKRPTMTYGYGSKKYGFADQLRDYLRSHDDWQTIRATCIDVAGKSVVHEACDLMALLIWNALQQTVVAASEGMEWMQKAVLQILANGTAVEWIVPVTGFPVRQEYFESEKKQIKTVLAGKVIQPSYHKQLDTIRPLKQRNAIAPNVVHSLDAAALEMTVTLAMSRGVTAFGCVHDSYSTHACDTGILAAATRESFVSLYRDNDVVGSLYAQWCAQAKDATECPAPPALGTLDLNVILDSPYFFA